MNAVKSAVSAITRARRVFYRVDLPIHVQKYHEGPPQPFDNLPFRVPNRYVATFVWCIFFGSGFWAPFLILWYSMAKRTL